jgi:uncharacterized membrane protein
MSDADQQRGKTLVKTGIIGTLVAAACCFTPLAVIALTGIGLTAALGGIDYVVFPIMFASLGLVAYAVYLQAGRRGFDPKAIIMVLVIAFSALLLWLEFRYALRISLLAVVLVAGYWLYLRSAGKAAA